MLFAVKLDEMKEPFPGNDSLKNTSIHREFQAGPEEIPKRDWHEPEKPGYDVSFERALADWIIRHCADWRNRRQSETQVGEISTS